MIRICTTHLKVPRSNYIYIIASYNYTKYDSLYRCQVNVTVVVTRQNTVSICSRVAPRIKPTKIGMPWAALRLLEKHLLHSVSPYRHPSFVLQFDLS